MPNATPKKLLAYFVLEAIKYYDGAASTSQIRKWLCKNRPVTSEDMYQFRWRQQDLKKAGILISPTESLSGKWELLEGYGERHGLCPTSL